MATTTETAQPNSSPAPALPPNFPITWRHDVHYELARLGRVFNHRRPSRHPLAVVEAIDAAQVATAVRLARSLGARVSVRSGGHSWAAWSVREGAVLIDLGHLHHFSFDADTGVASVSPSTTGRMLNKFLGPLGRMFAGGHCPEVALGGFLLQGGMGWNCKNWGFAYEKLVAIDVVTADGEELRCDEKQNSDLFWAARGAGPGFPAIVTRFHLATMPAFSHLRSSAYFYNTKDYRKAMEWILKITPTYNDSAEIVAVASYPPGQSELLIMVLIVVFANNEEEARTALQPAEDTAPTGHVMNWFAKETSLADQYNDQHAANPTGHRYAVDNCYVCNDADVVSVLEPAFTTLPSRRSFSLWYSMAPGSRRSAAAGTMPDMALSMQTDHYFATYAIWEHAYDDARCQAWVRGIFDEAQRHSAGAYLGDADFQVRRTPFWGEEQGRRLMEVRRKWDPNGVVSGYLDEGDKSGVNGLQNVHEWEPRPAKQAA